MALKLPTDLIVKDLREISEALVHLGKELITLNFREANVCARIAGKLDYIADSLEEQK